MKKLWLVVVVGLALSTAHAHAAPPDPSVQEAMAHFKEGAKAYSLGDFAHAVVEYKAAYSAKPDPAFLYNIAQSYRLASDPQQAVFFYRSYLRASPGPHPEVEEHIRRLEAQLVLTKTPDTVAPVDASRPLVDHWQAAPHPIVALAPIEPPPHGEPKPVYKKGWFWGVVVGSVVVAGVAIGLGVGLGLDHSPSAPGTDLGNSKVFALGVRR